MPVRDAAASAIIGEARRGLRPLLPGLTQFTALANAALMTAVLLGAAPALAQTVGGTGGTGAGFNSDGTGGAGGEPGRPGKSGDNATANNWGGGGGGGGGAGGGLGKSGGSGDATGTSGGDGGNGGVHGQTTAGSITINAPPSVGAGKDGGGGVDNFSINSGAGGGGGGGAGGFGLVVTGTGAVTNQSTITGGNGGVGGSGGNASGTSSVGGDGGSGGGGGVGVNLTVSGASLTNTDGAVIQGGNGGVGGDGGTFSGTGPPGGGPGGNGGAGGAGVFGSGARITNSGTVQGGNGGAGGGGADFAQPGGNGGAAGAGISGNALTIINTGTIQGGNGGNGGSGVACGGGCNAHGTGPFNSGGNGGAGISGSDLTIINAGTIAGGTGGRRSATDGANGTNGNPITFTGGTNTLEIRSGSNFMGNVVAFSSADTFRLGGATSDSFDVSAIGDTAQYQGFGTFVKTGSSTWRLTGTPAQATPWTLRRGTLSVSSDDTLDTQRSDLTFDGGTLRVTGTSFTSTPRTINWEAGGGGWDIANADNVFEVDQVLDGSGPLTKLGDGTLDLTGANLYTGRTTINAGTLRVTGSIVSDVRVNRDGTLGGTGRVNANVLNRGTVAPGNSIGDLTIMGNYVGRGGILEIESVLAGNSSPTDRLLLDGGSASGSTAMQVKNLGGPGDVTSGNGISVVVAKNGATTTTSAFSGSAGAGPYHYELRRGSGSAEARQSWYLASHKKGSGPQPFPGPSPVPNPQPGPEPVPLYRPEASAYAALPAMARAQSLAALGTFHERQGDQGLVRGAENDRAWGRIFVQRSEQHHSGLLRARFDGDTTGLQAGIDALRFTSPSGYETAMGLFFAYAHSEGDAYGHNLGLPDNFAGKPELDGASVGAYWTRIAPNGAYVDAVAMATHYDSSGHSTNMIEIDADGTGLMASLEAGYPIALGYGLTLEPQAQAIYQHLAFDNANDPFSSVDFDTPDAVVGRLGVRLTGAFGNWRPYLKANLWQDWVDEDTALYAGVHTVDSEHASTALELGGGVVANLGPRWGLWADAAYTQDISGEEREVVRGTAGLRVLW